MEWIDAATAADRLGVKPATLYAYVSRGVLKRRHEGRRSFFDAAEIEALARRGRPRGQPPELVIESAITALGLDRHYYRGHDALDLARTTTFEATAERLWTPPGSAPDPDGPHAWRSDPAAVHAAVTAQRDLPDSLLPLDRLQVITTVLGATDLLRFQLDPASVAATARRLITGLAEALPLLASPADTPGRAEVPGHAAIPDALPAPAGSGLPEAPSVLPGQADISHPVGGQGAPQPGPPRPEAGRAAPERAHPERRSPGSGTTSLSPPIAERLWPRLSPHPPSPALLRALEAALVLLADHELAASTLAARVAASAKADPYAVVLTGLGVLSGPLHGGASYAAEQLLTEVDRPTDAPRVIADWVRRGRRIPGFGHSVYKNGDARATLLLDLVEEAVPGHDRVAAARAVAAEVRRRRLPEANIDFALATLAAVSGMIPGAGEAAFAIARTAGWLAHAMEEYARNSLLRLRASYTGPPLPKPSTP
ncbi:citrate/2-methylcitrate synthase [Nonomuraea sp. NPDC048826]|uniref:citrate/2-methylcitrate synthase n=1 Tax=Nonomuraea sp. NPDC048826 TaxID=3364347 RepID=UPI003710DA63